jgi:tRNA (guanine37-N1)-methyltransferase
MKKLPRAIDFVGDIAIIEIPPELEAYKKTISEAILKTHKNVCTVLAKAGTVDGVYRLREFTVLAGIEKTETVHREHGCLYQMDLAKTYFSPRLSYEHDRVASQVTENEFVIDMFAGVGPFSILIAKKLEQVRVCAIDINPAAVASLTRNVALNRVNKKVTPLLGDVREVIKARFTNSADRVIMNLPKAANAYVNVACEALKPKGGVVHYYDLTRAPNPLETACARLTEEVRQAKREVVKILSTRRVRETAPFQWQVVVDARIQ